MPVVEYQGKEYLCREDENILVALLRQGVELKHSCRAGVCNACVMQATEADGESLKVGALDADQIGKGHFLPCKTRVKKRLVMREPAASPKDSFDLVISKRLTALGVDEDRILVDPFETVDQVNQATETAGARESNQSSEEKPYPDTQPELWQWLEQDNRLGAIISDFYERIFNDELLLPYFHNTTQQRSREKVYSFYKRLFSGEPCFFGDRPRNAHHWMVITHEIYDHRLRLLESTLRDHQMPEHLRAIWLQYEDYYRSDIVKDEPRGRRIGDITLPATGFGRETLTCGAICDSCGAIIEEGENVLYHLRTGQLYCRKCEGGQSQG